jgi:RNA polymerase sigma-70 factor, ECF subfamily
MRRELIEASELLRRHTPEAVEQAVDLLQSTVYSFSMKICGHREDAEDTMQHVLFQSMEHLARFPDPEALAAWLYTVTKNRCSRIRRPRAHAPARMLSIEELMPAHAELQALIERESESPENKVLDAEQHQLLHKAVLGLPPALRVVLVLHDMEELTTDQVAKILDLRPGTVGVRLHRARLTLRSEMRRILNREGSDATKELHAGSGSQARSGRTKRSVHCRELFSKLSEYLDGNVSPSTCEQIEAHMSACPNCIAFLNDLRASIDRCKSLEIPCDPTVTSRLRALFTQEYQRLMGHLPHQDVKATSNTKAPTSDHVLRLH